MTTEEALQIVADIAGRWGENAEEAFVRRIKPDDSDETCREIARTGLEGEDIETEIGDVMEVRDLWRALAHIDAIIKQRGCEHFDRAVNDGKLTTLCDIVISG